jgi:SAM-dependent methyltransferase
MDYKKINIQQEVSERDPFTINRYKQFAKYIRQNRKANSILDVGCNTGRGGEILKHAFPQSELIGLDVVDERLNNIPSHIYSRLVCGSATDRLFDNELLDAIVGGEFIEHISSDDVNICLGLFYQYLAKGGILLLTTPNPDAYQEKMKLRVSVYDDPSHLCIMSIKDLAQRLKKAGFKTIKVKGSGKASNYFPDWFPVINIFGSYLIIAQKS